MLGILPLWLDEQHSDLQILPQACCQVLQRWVTDGLERLTVCWKEQQLQGQSLHFSTSLKREEGEAESEADREMG